MTRDNRDEHFLSSLVTAVQVTRHIQNLARAAIDLPLSAPNMDIICAVSRFEGDRWWAAFVYQIRAVRKFISSFGKRVWTVEDYPIVIRHRERSRHLGARFIHYPWSAHVINWWHMRGDAATMDLAIEDLRKKLSDHDPQELPRPGTGRPLEISYASQEQITKLEHIAEKFFPAILDMAYEDCLITDESSLWDFHGDETNDEYYRRILDQYTVDVSDIQSGNLVEILRRIDGKLSTGA
jgi:hypothetical protein